MLETSIHTLIFVSIPLFIANFYKLNCLVTIYFLKLLLQVQDGTSTGHSTTAPSPPPTQINKLKLGPITIKREKRQNSSRFNVVATNRELQVLQSLNGMHMF